jgi:shikimate dehydrogenase
MDSKPARYAVIGNPVAHSRSPAIHAMFAAQTGQHIEYGRLLAPLDGFHAAVESFRAEGGRGLNVTVPFKPEAHAYATVLTPRAAVAGAVNTLAFEANRVLGDNTDGAGLVSDLRERLGIELKGARLLLLGAGGAARGVLQPLLEAGVEQLVVANRTGARAVAMRDDVLARLPAASARLQAGGLSMAQGRFDIVINGTAAGLSDAAPEVPESVLQHARLALDMVYGAQPTAFMRLALNAGCPQVEDGLGMLVGQAAESFALWRGVRPLTAPVHAAIRAELSGAAPQPR